MNKFESFLYATSIISSKSAYLSFLESLKSLPEEFKISYEFQNDSLNDELINTRIHHAINSIGLGRIFIVPNMSSNIDNIKIIISSSVPLDCQFVISVKNNTNDYDSCFKLLKKISKELYDFCKKIKITNYTEFWHLSPIATSTTLKSESGDLEVLKNYEIEIDYASKVLDTKLYKCSHEYGHDLYVTVGKINTGISQQLRYLPIVKESVRQAMSQLNSFKNLLQADQSLSTEVVKNINKIQIDELINFRKLLLIRQNELSSLETLIQKSESYINLYVYPLKHYTEEFLLNYKAFLKHEISEFDENYVVPLKNSFNDCKKQIDSDVNVLRDSIDILNIKVNLKIQKVLRNLQIIQVILAIFLFLLALYQIIIPLMM